MFPYGSGTFSSTNGTSTSTSRGPTTTIFAGNPASRRNVNWNIWIVAPAAALGAVLVFGVLYLAMPKAGEQMEEFR